ncbi:MAG: YHS domain-containing (seleno)protein [Pseudomonadota bacterium]
MMHNTKVLAIAVFLTGFAPVMAAQAAETVPVIVDNYTGYAIDGYDPLTYFMGSVPQKGIDGFEARWGGVSWRFINEGNRKAFMISPLVYMPQYGGHDPVALSRGLLTRGDPLIYLLHEDKLYFFFSPYAREDFLTDAARTLRSAQQNWPRLKDARD